VAALDKTKDGAEWRISARSVTDFHWTGTDPIHLDRFRSRVSTKISTIVRCPPVRYLMTGVWQISLHFIRKELRIYLKTIDLYP